MFVGSKAGRRSKTRMPEESMWWIERFWQRKYLGGMEGRPLRAVMWFREVWVARV